MRRVGAGRGRGGGLKDIFKFILGRTGEPEPGVFGSLEPEPLKKNKEPEPEPLGKNALCL